MTDWNFAQSSTGESLDEMGVNLRAYFDLMPDEKMQQYRPEWPDEALIAWDGNFTAEGVLILPGSEFSEVDIDRYRRVLEQAIAYRAVARGD